MTFALKPATLAALTALTLVGCSNSAGPGAEPGTEPGADGWPAFDAVPTGRANQGHIVAGKFVGSDEVHFARGANADGLHHEQYYAPGGIPPQPQPTPVESDDVYRHSTWGAFGTDRAAHNGDYLLPTDTANWPDFTADLAFLRMEADALELFIQLRFLSFPRPDAQIATISFSTAGSTPALVPWPRNAGVSSAYTMALTVHGSGAELSDAQGQSQSISDLGGAMRVTDHAFELRLPLNVLPAGPWRIGVGAGLADPADPSQYWSVAAGAPTASSPGTDASSAPGANVWDLMFTPHDPDYHDDHLQADLLLAGDVTAAQIIVDPAMLQNGADLPAPAITGRIAHSYESAFDFGDGISRGSPGTPPVPAAPVPAGVRPRDTAVNYEYTGGVQPYFAYIPQAYPGSTHDWPLILYFHGLNNYIWEPFGLTLGLEQQLEDRGYLFASLLGRGDISFEGRGELDPLEVIQHMSARYRVDPDRIYLVGHSHGGGGVLNVARRNPDLFAAVVSAQITEASAQPENFLQLPTLHIAGAQDPIDTGASAQSRYDALSALGYDASLLIYQAKTHENSSIHDALNEIFDLYDRSSRDPNPATVIYSRAGNDFDSALGLEHDRAYWVSGLQAADPAQAMSIRVESFAIPHAPLDPDAATRNDNALVDTAGPSGRSIALLSQTTPAFGPPVAVENRAALVASNIAAATLDTQRMALQLRAAGAAVDLQLDTALQLRLNGVTGSNLAWQILDADGAQLASGSSPRVDGGFEIPLPAGAARLRF